MTDYNPAFPKVGPKIKSAKIWNKKTRIHAIDKPDVLICDRCDTEDPTCSYRHPEDDNIKYMFGGRGISEKVDDDLSSLLCDKCDAILSRKPDKNAHRVKKLDHSMLWAKSIIKSLIRRLNEKEKS